MDRARNSWKSAICGLVLTAALSIAASAGAEPIDPHRSMVGVKIFSALLSADQELDQKLGPDGRLLLIVLTETSSAGELGARLRAMEKLRGIPVNVEFVSAERLARWSGPPAAGIFVADWLPDFSLAVSFAEKHHSLLFSPLYEDLKRGAHGGLLVSDRILPVINESALNAAGIRLKPFFLEVAKRYGSESTRP